jgi:putative ABC transport system permease protein
MPPLFSSLRTASRILINRWRTTFLNVGGLALGIATFLLAGLYVWTQLSYDHAHEGAERMYRIHEENRAHTFDEIWFDLRDAFPGSATAAMFIPVDGLVQSLSPAGEPSVNWQSDDFYYASPSVFDVFTYPLARGSARTALADPGSIVLSQEAAERLFPDRDPMGQTVVPPGTPRREYTVTGILQPLPKTLHVRPDFLAPVENLAEENGEYFYWVYVYVKTAGATTGADVVAWLNEQRAQREGSDASPLIAQPLLDVWLGDSLMEEIAPTGNRNYVWAFGIVGLLVLLIACVNYVNLTTAQISERMREVGLRKTFGASRGHVASFFVTESLLVTTTAAAAGLGLALSILPFVREHVPDPIVADRLASVEGAAFFFTVIAVTTLVSSAYPAAVLSNLRPARLFRSKHGPTGTGTVRRVLVVGQFAMTMALAAVTFVVVQQTRYLGQKDLGLDREQTLMVNTRVAGASSYGVMSTGERRQRLDRIEQRLKQYPEITATGRMAYRPNSDFVFFQTLQSPNAEEAEAEARLMFGTEGVSRALGIDLVEGRRLDEAPEGILINRAAADRLGEAGTVGARVTLDRPPMMGDTTTVVAGILENFHYQSLRTEITPAFLYASEISRRDDYLFVRAAPGKSAAVENLVREAWDEVMPTGTYSASFMDQEFAQMHAADRQQRTLLLVLAGIALGVACMGLVGLVTYVADRRRAEIGIRKTLGATSLSIVHLLTRDVATGLGIAAVLAAPVAYLAASTWLDQFAYQVDLQPTPFLASAAIVGVLALLACATCALQAAQTDPARAVREE